MDDVSELPESLRLPFDDAIHQINDLSYYQLDTLVALFETGLRKEHLQAWRGRNHTDLFEREHAKALVALVKGGHSIEDGYAHYPWHISR